jgi:hypothetical protein
MYLWVTSTCRIEFAHLRQVFYSTAKINIFFDYLKKSFENLVTFPSIATLMVKPLSQKEMEIHVGHLIKEVFDRQGRRATWLAAELNCNRSNVYSIFQRDNIDAQMLILISRVLGHNFLTDLAPWAEGQE